MAHIDYYFSTVSPWAYLAGNRLEEAAARHGATITYKPIDLGTLFPQTGGVALPDRHPSRQAYRLQELDRQSRKLGMPLNLRPAFWPVNGAPAAYAIIAAQGAGGGDVGALAQAIMRACWAEEKNIAEDETIRACLAGRRLRPGACRQGAARGRRDLCPQHRGGGAGGRLRRADFYVVDTGQKFWGQDRLEDLDLHLAGKL
jgi:2-hydroxychromene-2-carboxylate isomerase